MQREVIEIKVVRPQEGLQKTIQQGAEQTRRCMDQCGATHGHLLVFDTRGRLSWAKRVYCKALAANLTLWGC